MQKIISGVIFLSHIIFPSLAVADSLVQAEADVLIYEIDSQLSYSDYLAKVESADQSNGSRTLGLSYLKIATEIQSGLSSSFYFVLRPDVGTDRNSAGESTVTREFDSRIGTVHRAAPTVNLLDEYRIIFRSDKNLDLSVGVFDELVANGLAYESGLEFGLNVLFPQKFSAINLQSSFLNRQENVANVTIQTGLESSVFIFQGHEDRAELVEKNGQNLDSSNLSQDPYLGLALISQWIPSPFLKYGLALGYVDNAAEPHGKNNETFASLNMGWDLPIEQRWIKLMAAINYSREKWRVDNFSISDLVQQSVALSTAIQISQRNRFLMSAQIGRSDRFESNVIGTGDSSVVETDRSKANPVSGYQIELAMDSAISKAIIVQFGIAHENRLQKAADGGDVGAFLVDGENKNSVERFALNIKYQLVGNR